MAKNSSLDDELHNRSKIRSAMRDVAKEMGFAVKDIRSELIDRSWFDNKMKVQGKEAFEFYSPDVMEAAQAHDFSQDRDKFYSNDDEKSRTNEDSSNRDDRVKDSDVHRGIDRDRDDLER